MLNPVLQHTEGMVRQLEGPLGKTIHYINAVCGEFRYLIWTSPWEVAGFRGLMKHRAVGRDGVAVQHLIHLQGVDGAGSKWGIMKTGSQS